MTHDYWYDQRKGDLKGRVVFGRGRERDVSVDRKFSRTGPFSLPRTWRDRLPVGDLVTSKLMGDPPPWWAGRTPPCEDELTAAEIQAAQRAPLLAARRFAK